MPGRAGAAPPPSHPRHPGDSYQNRGDPGVTPGRTAEQPGVVGARGRERNDGVGTGRTDVVDQQALQQPPRPVLQLEELAVEADRLVGVQQPVSTTHDDDIAARHGLSQRGARVLVEGAGVAVPGRQQPALVRPRRGEHPAAGPYQRGRPTLNPGCLRRPAPGLLRSRALNDQHGAVGIDLRESAGAPGRRRAHGRGCPLSLTCDPTSRVWGADAGGRSRTIPAPPHPACSPRPARHGHAIDRHATTADSAGLPRPARRPRSGRTRPTTALPAPRPEWTGTR
jgi:hypothetical protein